MTDIENGKQTKSKIPDNTITVRNAVTGERSIAARDATIEAQHKVIEQLREELAPIKSIPSYIRDHNLCVDDRFGEGFWEAVDEVEKLMKLEGKENGD